MKLGAYFGATTSDQTDRLQKLEERISQFTSQLQATAAAMFSDSDESVHDEIAPKQVTKSTKTAQKAQEPIQREIQPEIEETKKVKAEKKKKPDLVGNPAQIKPSKKE